MTPPPSFQTVSLIIEIYFDDFIFCLQRASAQNKNVPNSELPNERSDETLIEKSVSEREIEQYTDLIWCDTKYEARV